MPRPKKINNKKSTIKVSDITIQDIADNDCVSIDIYISDLDERMWYLIEKFYKLTIIGEKNGFFIKFNNSWKGLIQLLLSVLYCKIGDKIVLSQAEYNFVCSIRVEHDFKLLKSQYIPSNPIIEKLYIPTSYRPTYTRSNYTNKNVIDTIMSLCQALKINIKKSKVSVDTSSNSIKNYKCMPIKTMVDIGNLICGILPKCSNEGTAFITKETMKLLLDKYRILVAHPIKTPQQMKKYNEDEWDCTYPYKFLAYPVLKRYEEQLIQYFPLCKESIKYYAQKTDKFEYALNNNNYFLEIGCDYIITDFISLGKWG